MDFNESMDQGPVLTCRKEDCSFNRHECCCASAIEVGDEHAMCDTYTRDPVNRVEDTAVVSACHVVECVFNGQMECHAPGITVGDHIGHADCLTSRTN